MPSTRCRPEYARIFLKITNIRVERLQDISEEDCIKEGIFTKEIQYEDDTSYLAYYGVPDFKECSNVFYEDIGDTPERKSYKQLWNSKEKETYQWDKNPYVFVYDFKLIKEGK